MASIKKSIRLADLTKEACRVVSQASPLHDDDGIRWSSAINSMADEYVLIMEDSKPDLTPKQWQALFCVYNGYMPSQKAEDEAKLLSWHVSEGYKYDSQVTELLGTENEAKVFLAQIENWSLTTKLAAIYHAKSFWANPIK